MSSVLFVIAPERFRDEELFETQSVLERAGHQSVIASTKLGLCPGSRGGYAEAIRTLDKESGFAYDAIVFVGGGGTTQLFGNADAWRIAREAMATGKVVGAICLAPVILANAGVLAGRQATVAGTQAATLEAKGAYYTGPGVTVDGRLVTANGPKSSRAFAIRIVELLAGAGPVDAS